MPEITYNLISSEAHIVEPPDLFERGLPKTLLERAPRMVTVADGGSAWSVDGSDPLPLAASTATGSGWHRAAGGVGIDRPVRWEAVLPALYDPAERLRAQWTDSIDAEILYPTPELWDAIRQLPDAELKVASVRAYNDWLTEFCSHAPERYFGLAKLPTTSVEDAQAELQRCVGELGLHGAILDAWPSGASAGGNEADDPFWATVNELQVPISLHYGFGAAASTEPRSGIAPGMRPPMADTLLPMVAAGVFDRFPDVKIVFAHGDAGWAPHWMEFSDINYVRHKHLSEYALQDPDAVPSDYIRKHAWFTFHQDRPAVKNRHRLGRAHLMWASHFPYEESNWPDDRQQAMRVTDEAPADERHALLAGNVARLYRLPTFEKGFTDDEISSFDRLVHF
jgi:predicted TIM-barrel fold metal-dependent hydrolase